MADDYLAQYLMALEKQAAADNPYSRFGGVADDLGRNVVTASPNYGLGESVAAAAVLGLLGGGLDSMAQSYNAEKSAGLYDVLSGRVSAQPESLGNPLYKKALTYRDLIRAQRLQDFQDQIRDAQLDVGKASVIDEMKLESELGAIPRREAATLLGKERALEELSRGSADAEAAGLKDAKDGGGEVKRPGALTSMGKELRSIEERLQDRFAGLDEVKAFVPMERAASALSGALGDDNVISDQELVRYSILMIEPGLAVREGEAAAIAASQSIPQAWKGEMDKALNGKSAMSPEAREGIKNLASRAYDSGAKQYNRALDFYETQAKTAGVDPSTISRVGRPKSADEIFGGATAVTTPTKPSITAADLQAEALRRGLITP